MNTWQFCPVCGHRIYQHGGPATATGKQYGGCTHVETTGHVLKVSRTGWTLKHPVAEREADRLFNCKIHRDITRIADAVSLPPVGEYAIVENDSGGWSYEPVDRAREQCSCIVPYDLLRVQRV